MSNRPRKRPAFRPQSENLEDRKLLSSTAGAHHTGSALVEAQALRMQRFSQLASRGRSLGPGINVTTYHNSNSRDGWYPSETTLSPQNVNPTSFGKLWAYHVDGHINAQPLYLSNVRVDGAVRNIVIVATEEDSVYAFDANNPHAGPWHNGMLWHTSFINPNRGVTPVPAMDINEATVTPVLGIIDTPVYDPQTGASTSSPRPRTRCP